MPVRPLIWNTSNMPTQAINSISRVCQILQRGYGVVTKAAAKLRLQPVATIDGVPFFDDEQVEALRQHFEGKRPSRS